MPPAIAGAAPDITGCRGVPADERSCGRTLAEDLEWVRGAIAAIKLG
jgi:hypothetical protein